MGRPGGYIHALAFLARGYGLVTCPQEAWARLYDTVGDYLKLPLDQMLFCGMAVGYGDQGAQGQRFPLATCGPQRVLQALRIRLVD